MAAIPPTTPPAIAPAGELLLLLPLLPEPDSTVDVAVEVVDVVPVVVLDIVDEALPKRGQFNCSYSSKHFRFLNLTLLDHS